MSNITSERRAQDRTDAKKVGCQELSACISVHSSTSLSSNAREEDRVGVNQSYGAGGAGDECQCERQANSCESGRDELARVQTCVWMAAALLHSCMARCLHVSGVNPSNDLFAFCYFYNQSINNMIKILLKGKAVYQYAVPDYQSLRRISHVVP